MAGGIGSRFWPFSRNGRPKQFLDFFGTGRSLLQLTFDRFSQVVPVKNMLIVTNHIYKDLVLEQLPDLSPDQILAEPHRRNTAPCVAYAVSRIQAMTDRANIIVAPSDHLILKEGAFLDTLREGLAFIERHDVLLTLGIQPSRPETGYGYIQVDEGEGPLRRVKTFTEKPDADLAKVFFETGEFYWNSGIFLWNLQAITEAYRTLLPDIAHRFAEGRSKWGTPQEQAFVNEIYPACQNISLDYGIMEKASNVYVLCADFGWTDLGTWGSLYDMSKKDEQKNVTLKCQAVYYDSERNVVALPEDKLVVVQGLTDYIVAEADDVLLICRKSEEQRIRQFVNDVNVMFDGEYS